MFIPDKGSGVLILNNSDYINKILSISDDTSKFRKLVDISFDDTAITEVKFHMRLLEFPKKHFLLKTGLR